MICIFICITSCNITKNVPDGYFLMNSNKILVKEKVPFKDDLTDILKLKPNQRILGVRLKLRVYNAIDSAKLTEKRIKVNQKFKLKLQKKKDKYSRINEKRIERAKRRGKDFYTEKIIKDTVNNDLLFRERMKYKFGEDPKVFDSTTFNKASVQINNYIRKRGYYIPKLTSKVVYDSSKRKADVLYELVLGSVFKIDSVFYSGDPLMIRNHKAYLNDRLDNEDHHPLIKETFDIDVLDDYRQEFSKDMRKSFLL